MFSTEEKILILGSLFHDIGKFQQRGVPESDRLKYNDYSSGFVNRIFGNQLLSNIVFNHHREDLEKSNLKGKDRILAEIICEADNLASGDRETDKSINEHQPLECIFSKVNYGNQKIDLYFQNLCELYYSKYEFPYKHDERKLENLTTDYINWWRNFEEELSKVNKDELETIIYVLKKYLWCIPSSSYKTCSDVSLFEHSKITAAIAISMFRYFMEKFNNDINNIKDISNREENRYLLILGDITGIQTYIYNIGHKGAAKSLKGRSFFLQQMLENIAYYILDIELQLPITNLIYSSGGKFYLFVPNTNSVREKLSFIQKKLEEKFLYKYNGSLGIVFGMIELNGKDLEYDEEGKEHPISEKWDKLNSIVEHEKKKKLSRNWYFSLFEPSSIDGEIIKCAYSNVPLIKKEIVFSKKTLTEKVNLAENSPVQFLKHSFEGEVFYQIFDNDKLTDDFISEEQFNSQKIGNDLKRNIETLIFEDIIQGYAVFDLNSFNISSEKKYENKYNAKFPRLFSVNSLKINSLEGNANKGFKFYGGDWRLGDTFDEVIKKGPGIERLGVLRLDVDNLGRIFKEGFGKQATFGRIVQLSSMLDFFFSHYLNKIKFFSWDPVKGLSNKFDDYSYKVRDLIEIVYSGGDDVFIVGHWSILPDIAIWINEEFKKFTGNNNNFSISAGISLFDDKYPIYKAALEAGDLEEKAKRKERKNKEKNLQGTKNGICFLDTDTPVSWNDFKIIRKYVSDFYTWIMSGIGEKKLSRGFISRLYSIYYEYEEGKYENWAKWRWRASYSLTRLAKQYEETFGSKIKNFAAELFTSNKIEQELIHLLFIIANWTDLLTRKKEK